MRKYWLLMVAMVFGLGSLLAASAVAKEQAQKGESSGIAKPGAVKAVLTIDGKQYEVVIPAGQLGKIAEAKDGEKGPKHEAKDGEKGPKHEAKDGEKGPKHEAKDGEKGPKHEAKDGEKGPKHDEAKDGEKGPKHEEHGKADTRHGEEVAKAPVGKALLTINGKQYLVVIMPVDRPGKAGEGKAGKEPKKDGHEKDGKKGHDKQDKDDER